MLRLKEETRDKLTLISIIVTSCSFLLAVLSLVFSGLKVILWLTIILALVLLGFLTVNQIRKWLESRSKVRFYRNWNAVPQRYLTNETLKYLTGNVANLEIIGRTCFRWLCGDENDFKSNRNLFQKNQAKLQGQIVKAIESGSSIHLVLQNPNVPVPLFKKSENELLREHGEAAIKSYEDIRAKLIDSNRNKLTLSFSNEVIENSMLRLIENSKITRLILDLSIQFKASRISDTEVSKPVLIFSYGGPGNEEYVQEFDYILSKAIPKEEYDKKREEGHNEVESLVKKYSHHSILRRDESRLLATIAARYFLAENDPTIKEVPPVSIQLLVTNQCTTRCKMCDHYNLFNAESELTIDELRYTLECIKSIGTRAIIISGGEPLARQDLLDILEYGKSLDLNIGLLTNGLMKEGKSLSLEAAKVISKSCSWVQLSIDSFNKNTYRLIRGNDYLDAALESLRNIVQADLKAVEVCFTIQKDNIEELANISEAVNSQLPLSVAVRFKFAHGPLSGRDFLCSKSQLEGAIKHLLPRENRFNSAYLLSMIQDGYFSYEGLSQGVPLKEKMIEYHSSGYSCHVLRFTCKIDSNGDVYPCCFLFDDNNASSEFRKRYSIGSLRSEKTGRVMPPDRFGNALAAIWYKSERLRIYRRDVLPVNQEACSYCTRHFYQNEYLNKLYEVFERYRHFGIFDELAEEGDSNSTYTFWV